MKNNFPNYKIGKNCILTIVWGLVAILLLGVTINGCEESLTGSQNIGKNSIDLSNNQTSKIEKKSDIHIKPGRYTNFRKIFKAILQRENKKEDQIMKEAGLYMEDYKFIGKINSPKSINKLADKMTAAGVYFPVYDKDDMSNLKNFDLKKKSELENLTNQWIPYNIKNLKQRLKKKFKVDYEKVQIEWNYKGNELTTLAIVNNQNSFIYGNIFSHLITVKASSPAKILPDSTSKNLSQSLSPLLKINEVENGCPGGNYNYPVDESKSFNPHIEVDEDYGLLTAAEASVSFTIYGSALDKCTGTITHISSVHHECEVKPSFYDKYSCDAEAQITETPSGTGNNTHAQIPYAMFISRKGYGTSLSFEGSGYSYHNTGGIIKERGETKNLTGYDFIKS